MRDINAKKIAIPREAVYKDVVIIGNGPSGITLSYMLSGHWPYWVPEKVANHPDELLRARLNCADNTKSLVEQDLMNLADGLEGRSTNPVSLLLDSLQNPCADIGMQVPSMLQYKHHADKQIDHVVLGKGLPGGSWHRMDPNLRTLSLSAWMSLPGLDFNTWDESHPENEIKSTAQKPLNHIEIATNNQKHPEAQLKSIQKPTKPAAYCHKCADPTKRPLSSPDTTQNNNENEIGSLCCRCTGATAQPVVPLKNNSSKLDVNSVKSVAFDIEVSLHKNNAISNQVVPPKLPRRNLSVKRQMSKEVQTRALVSRVADYYASYVHEMGLEKYFMNDTEVTSVLPIHGRAGGRFKNARWIVFTRSGHKTHIFVCKNLVLATGASDLANRLGLPEENIRPWVKHDLTQLETALKNQTEQERTKIKPVLVVGAGLSAADAVTICRSSGVNVIHVYRNRSAGLDKMLPENVYPEYHEVHKMMKDSQNTYDLYNPLPEHTITNVASTAQGQKVTVQHLATGETKVLDVSYCAILIGSRPDLRFLSNVITKDATKENRPINIDELITRELENGFAADRSNVITDEPATQQWSLVGKKIAWLKNLCAKCRHLNLCEWSRRNDYKRNCCRQNHLKYCECASRMQPLNATNRTITNGDDTKVAKVDDDNNDSAIGLGEDELKPIDCKANPVSVDKFTNEVLRTPKGLYSMGPLVGDNFIRFIPGGALAITAALHKEND